VPVTPNVPLNEGDILFKVDPTPYEYIVRQKKALLAEAEQNVSELKASLDRATAGKQRATAELQLAQQNYDREADLIQKGVITSVQFDTSTRNLESAKQALAGARAKEDHERLAYTSNIGGINTSVARLTAELGDAQFDLDQTVTRAPSHGFVTQLTLRPGMYVVPAPLRPVMVFVNTDPKDKQLTGAFWQNSLQESKAATRRRWRLPPFLAASSKGK
jgi:multidrug resistance efflux pump